MPALRLAKGLKAVLGSYARSCRLLGRRHWCGLTLTLLLAIYACPRTLASTLTWTGGGSDSAWDTAANWNPAQDPGTTPFAYVLSGTTRLDPMISGSDTPIATSLSFDSGAGAFTISQGSLVSLGGGIINNSTSLQTITSNIIIGGSQTWNAAAGDLAMDGTNLGGLNLTIDGAHHTTINSTIDSSDSFAGRLTKTGAGTLTLNGANFIPLGVELNQGAIVLGNDNALGANLLTVSGNAELMSDNDARSISNNILVDNNTTLTLGGTHDLALNGTILGQGGVTFDNSGTVSLNHMNTYTGVTSIESGIVDMVTPDAFTGSTNFVINGGTLKTHGDNQLSMSSLSGTGGSVELEYQGTIYVNQDADTEFAGSIQGPGYLIKDGDGTLILTGANTNSEATEVRGGILRAGSATALSQSSSYVTEGILDLNGYDLSTKYLSGYGTIELGTAQLTVTYESTFYGSIQGEGSLLQSTPSTLTLYGINTYTGGTTITDGILLAGSDTALPQNTPYTINGGELQLDGYSLTASSLSGTGGTIDLGSADLTADQDTESDFAGSIQGTGGFIKSGSGTLQLSGANTYTGETDVNAGKLVINGSITSDTHIAAGAALGGGGTILGDLNNSGRVAPGNSIGTLTTTGTYTQNAASTLEIEINSAGTTPGVNNDLLVTTDTTLLGGTVVVDGAPGTYTEGATYRFLQSTNQIQGQFSSITDNVGGWLATLDYDFYNGYYWAYFSLVAPDYAQYAVTPNELAVANYLDSLVPTASGDLDVVLNGLNSLSGDPAAMQAAFNSMSDQVSPTMAYVGIQNTTLVLQQLAGQLRSGNFLSGGSGYAAGGGLGGPADAASSRGPVMLVSYNKSNGRPLVSFVSQDECDCWRGWTLGYGLGGSASSTANAAGLTYGMGGTLLGAEKYFDDAGRIGFFGGYQGTSLQLNGLTQSGKINGGMLGGYFHNDDGFNYYTAIAGTQFNGFTTQRNIQFDGINRLASGNFSGWQGYGYLERGVSFRTANTTLQPYAALQYIYLRQNSYTESGADTLNLAVSGIDANSLRSLIGSRLQYNRGFQGGRLLPELRALWLHEFLNTTGVVNSFFAPVGGGSFAIQGLNLGRDWAILGGGVRYDLDGGWSIYGNYDAQVNAQQVFHVGSGGLTYAW